MSTESEDKRASPRMPLILRVGFSDLRASVAATENLSQGGFFVITDHPFKIGEQVPLSLSFPGLLDPVEIVGTVAWLRPGRLTTEAGVGLRVHREQDLRRLGDILNSAGPDTSASPSKPDGYRVLIVEDNHHIIEMYSYVLKKLASGDLAGKVPLEVQFAPDGHNALQQLREKTFHLVMTDLYMPVMDGFALVERIRQDEQLQGIPVIAISAGGGEAQERAVALGVDIFLRKPVRFLEVLETVKQLLRIK